MMTVTLGERSILWTTLLAGFLIAGNGACLFGVGAATGNGSDAESDSGRPDDASGNDDTEQSTNDGDSEDGCSGSDCECADPTQYYADCDSDSFASTESPTLTSCSQPSSGPNACTGDWITQAPEGDKADCNDSSANARPDFGHDDEQWRCDELDNDCDGTEDEACCGSNETPEPVQIGGGDTDQAHPALVPAAQGAPEGALFAVAWAEGSTLKIAHVKKSGEIIDGAQSVSTLAAANSIDLVRGGNGYAVAITRETSQSAPPIVLYKFGAQLGDSPATATVGANDTNAKHVSLAIKGQKAWLAFSEKTGQGSFPVMVATVSLPDQSLARGPFEVSSDAPPARTAPEIEVVRGSPTVVWWDKADSLTRGARLTTGSVDTRFRVPFTDDLGSSATAEPIEFMVTGGNARLLYPDYASSGTSVLKILSIAPDDEGKLNGATELSGDGNTNRQPSARTVDTTGDGNPDHLLVVWARGPKADPSIVVGSTSLENPETMTPETIVSQSADKNPTLAVAGGRGGAVWFDGPDSSDDDPVSDVKYAPLSIDGVPVCNPSP